MPLTVSNKPANDPIDLDELKDHLNMEGTTRFDSQLNLLIQAIVTPAQEALGQQLIKATRVWTISEWKQKVEMPRPPLITVSKVEYREEDTGTWQTVGTSNYEENTDAKPGFIRFINDYDVPDTDENEPYPWRFTYDCGYEDGGTSTYSQVPSELRLWMMNHIGTYFMKRESDVISTSNIDVQYLEKAMGRLIRGHNKNMRFG